MQIVHSTWETPAAKKSGHCVHVAHQATLEVGRFVAVDVAALRQTVNHADHLGQKLGCCCFIFQIAQVFDGRARRFFVIAILQTALFGLTNAF